MKLLKICFIAALTVMYLAVPLFSQKHADEQNLTHQEIITQIMELSGLNTQIPQIANTIANREDIKAYLSTLSEENREALEKEISMAFDGNALLAIVRDEMRQTVSEEEGKALLKWYTSEDAKALTALEEIPKEREDWKEIYRTKKDPKPDAIGLEIYKMLLRVMNFTEQATNEQVMLQRFLRGLILTDMQGYEIENALKNERKELAKEIWETALLSLTYDLASTDEKVLGRYIQFLASPAAKAYQKGKNIGLIRAISFAGDKVLSKAEELVVKYPYPTLSDLHPKTDELKRYKEGCESGDMEACSDLGYAYRKGKGVKRDYFKALTPLIMGCKGGNAKACGVLSDMYWLGLGVKINLIKAADYNRRSCDLGDKLGCNGLGMFYSTGYGVPKDQKKAILYFTKACNAGEEAACRNLGNHYRHGLGVEVDHVKAREFYEKACKGGNMSSCWQAGQYYYSGVGVKQDYQKAIALFEMSCSRGKAYACYDLGHIYAKGTVTNQDITKAKQYYKQGCQHGLQRSCKAYNALDKHSEKRQSNK